MPQTLIRVGHKGADHVAPGNTAASFQAALDCGVDMIEFDVLQLHDGRLVLAHDYGDASRREPMSLEEGLDLFAGEAYRDVELDVDLKLPGYEAEIVAGLTDRGLDGRALVSSTFPQSLARIGELAPGLRRGWSVPRARRDYTKSLVWALPAFAALRWIRAGLPAKAQRAIQRGIARRVRGVHGPPPAGQPPARRAHPRGRWAALRLDGRRRRGDRPVRGPRRRRGYHERPAPLRSRLGQQRCPAV
jgi:glycerophosphoryl diester phosphodiesterase